MAAHPRNLLLTFLCLCTLALGTLAWYERSVSAARIAAAEAAAKKQRADLEAQLAAAEQRVKDLEAQLASSLEPRRKGWSPDGEPLEPADSDEPPLPGRGRRSALLAELAQLMDNPEVSKLLALQQRGQIDATYAALFKALNLSPAQLSRFKELLAEKQNTFRDVLAAARSQGLDPRQDRSQIRQLVGQANAEVDQNIQNLLGASAYAQYKQYEQTAPQRTLVDQLSSRLSYTQNPLSQTQADQLVQVLAETTKPNNPTQNPARGPGGGRVTLTDASINQAGTVLTPDQLSALQQIQQEQQARQQIQQLLRRPPTPPPANPPPSG